MSTFTYDVTNDAGKVRLLCQDFDVEEMIFSDDEIQAFLDLNSADIRWAAAQALEVVAANETYVQKRITLLDLQTDGPAEAKMLLQLAKNLRDQAALASNDINDLFDYAEHTYDIFSARQRVMNEFLRSL
jgi:hypothetical protein